MVFVIHVYPNLSSLMLSVLLKLIVSKVGYCFDTGIVHNDEVIT